MLYACAACSTAAFAYHVMLASVCPFMRPAEMHHLTRLVCETSVNQARCGIRVHVWREGDSCQGSDAGVHARGCAPAQGLLPVCLQVHLSLTAACLLLGIVPNFPAFRCAFPLLLPVGCLVRLSATCGLFACRCACQSLLPVSLQSSLRNSASLQDNWCSEPRFGTLNKNLYHPQSHVGL